MSYAEQHLDEAARIVARTRRRRDRDGWRRCWPSCARAAAGCSSSASAAAPRNCSHAVNDFRKIAGIEAYAPTDNVSELTARTNDEGWDSVFVEWLKGSRLQPARHASSSSRSAAAASRRTSARTWCCALQYAKEVGAQVVGIVGRDGGYTAQVADACVIVPTVNPDTVTPHTEAFQAVIWHLLVSHPALKAAQTKWESTADAPPRRLPRPRRRDQPGRRPRRQAVSAGHGSDELEMLPGVADALRRLEGRRASCWSS